MSKISLILATLVVLVLPAQARGKHSEPVSTSVRAAAAGQMLKADSDSVLIYTKGLVCQSCAIGIRKHISRVPGVDRSRGKKGVNLDVKHQIVQVFTKGEVSVGELAQEIRDAGYTPVKAFQMKGKKVTTKKL